MRSGARGYGKWTRMWWAVSGPAGAMGGQRERRSGEGSAISGLSDYYLLTISYVGDLTGDQQDAQARCHNDEELPSFLYSRGRLVPRPWSGLLFVHRVWVAKVLARSLSPGTAVPVLLTCPSSSVAICTALSAANTMALQIGLLAGSGACAHDGLGASQRRLYCRSRASSGHELFYVSVIATSFCLH